MAKKSSLPICSLKMNFKKVKNLLMSLHIQRVRCKISYDKDLTCLQYKRIKMIGEIFDATPELPAGAYAEIFVGAPKCPFGTFSLCDCRRRDYHKGFGGMYTGNFEKLHSNIRDFIAFW